MKLDAVSSGALSAGVHQAKGRGTSMKKGGGAAPSGHSSKLLMSWIQTPNSGRRLSSTPGTPKLPVLEPDSREQTCKVKKGPPRAGKQMARAVGRRFKPGALLSGGHRVWE